MKNKGYSRTACSKKCAFVKPVGHPSSLSFELKGPAQHKRFYIWNNTFWKDISVWTNRYRFDTKMQSRHDTSRPLIRFASVQKQPSEHQYTRSKCFRKFCSHNYSRENCVFKSFNFESVLEKFLLKWNVRVAFVVFECMEHTEMEEKSCVHQ